jgi:hypothetical protein
VAMRDMQVSISRQGQLELTCAREDPHANRWPAPGTTTSVKIDRARANVYVQSCAAPISRLRQGCDAYLRLRGVHQARNRPDVVALLDDTVRATE